jgi:hypothetical protein
MRRRTPRGPAVPGGPNAENLPDGGWGEEPHRSLALCGPACLKVAIPPSRDSGLALPVRWHRQARALGLAGWPYLGTELGGAVLRYGLSGMVC